MVRKIVLSFVAVLGVVAAAMSQNRQVSGSVTGVDGQPIVGATVLVDGTSTGMTTSAEGTFSVAAPANGTLVISFVGYETQRIPVAGKTRIDVVLAEDATAIDQVVVVGYGSGSKVGTTLGSVAKVKGAVLENKPTANIADALQGKVAGFEVYTSSGEPSAASSMRLHGVGSLEAGSSPLIVLDGVPVDAGTLVSLNANDIESVNILKDASATSIYGSRAANGVMYIASKRGRRNEPVSFTVRAQYGISQPATNKYEVMNTAEKAGYQLEVGLINQERYDAIMASGINTNWRDYYYNSSAPTYQVDLSATGGSEKTSYYLSGSYMSKDGTAPGSSMERYSFRSNVDMSANKWLRMGANVALGYDKREKAVTTGNSVYNAAFMSVLTLPWETPYNEDGTEKELIAGYSNPNYYISKFPSNGKNLQINGNAYLQIMPVKGLSIKSQFGVDAFVYWSESFRKASYSGSLNNGSVSRGHQHGATLTSTTTVDYNFDFSNPDHKLYLLAGQEGIRYDGLNFSASLAGQISDKLLMISTGSGTPTASDSSSAYAFNSWFGRAEYSYADKYIFDASVRRDASSRFGVNNRSGIFYAVGAMWNIKKESFLADNRTISDLRLKASYGTQGNADIGNYAHIAQLSATTYQDASGLYISSMGNTNLGWETQELFTVAANIEFIRRIRLEAEFYNRSTKDMLMNVPMPSTSGYSSRFENVGSMINRGVDLTLNVDIVQTKDWHVGFNATFSYNKSKITKLFNGYTEYAMPNYLLCYAIGHDAGEFYMQKFHGVNPENGNPQWEVVDPETGAISLTENFNNATMQLLGKSRYAPYYGGFGVDASWKGISVAANFTWNYGKYTVNNMLLFLESPGNAATFNSGKHMLNMWRKPGDITNVPKWGTNPQFDSHMLEDASFLRLKNLTVAYDFPKSLIRKSGFIEGLRIYFIGRNLLTATGYSGYDPEMDTNLSLGNYPNSREFVGGIQLTF